MASQNGGNITEENVTPAPVISPALSVEGEESGNLDMSSSIQITNHGVLSKSKGNFRCKCTEKFQKLALLKLHIRKKVEKPRFKCHPCNKLFFFQSELKRHQKSKKCSRMTANYIAVPSESNGNGVGTSSGILDQSFAPVSSSSSNGRSVERSLGTPPHDLEMEEEVIIPVNNDERESDTDSSVSSSQSSDDSPSLSEMDEMEHSTTGIMNVNQRHEEEPFGSNRQTGWIDFEWYGCCLCKKSFRFLKW